MKPTVGRIVHYHLQPFTGGPRVTYAAMITGVEEDMQGERVSLCVFMDEATPKGRSKTHHVRIARYAATPTDFCWSWPPMVAK